MKSLNWMGIMNLFNCQYQKKKNLYSFRLYFFQVSFRGIIFKLMLTKHYISFLNPLNHMVLKWYTFVSASEELPEAVIIRDLVYAFQGIEGRWIRFDPTKEGYRINHQVTWCNIRFFTTKTNFYLNLSLWFMMVKSSIIEVTLIGRYS